MALLPTSQAGVVALVMMALSPSLMCRRFCHCHNGIIALVALVPLSTLHRHCHPCCTSVVILIALTSLPSRCMGIVTVVAPALSALSVWHVCVIAPVSLPLSHWHCCPWCTGISALVAQASLPLLCLHHAVDSQTSLLSLSWLPSRGQGGRPHRRQLQHQRNKGNNTSITRAAIPAQ
jgi:hypothetical protein